MTRGTQQLKEAVDRANEKHLTVVDTGSGSFTVTGNTRPDWSSDPSGSQSAISQTDVDDARNEIKGILSKATESDSSAKTVLMAIADQSALGFSDVSYKDRDAAADAVKEADELARLAKKKPEDLTVEEFDRLNAGLKKYHDDPLFSERFATDLGPEETLSFWADISDPPVTPQLTRERRFKYLFEDRHWPHESNSDFSSGESVDGRNNLALALEAATTGHAAGELPTADTPAHTAAQAGLMRELVNSVSEDPNRLKDHDCMADSIGQIGSEYLPDIHRAMADGPTVKDGTSGWNLLYPLAGEDAKLDHNAVTRFLVTAGQNPEGYSALSVGEKAYTASLMDYHLNPDLPADQRYPHDAQETITSLSRKSGEFSGLLAQGRQEAVLGPAAEKDSDFDYAVSQKKNVISGIVGTGVGIGTSFIASPVVGAGVGGAAGTVTSVVLEGFFKDESGAYRSEAGHDIATRWETIKDSTTNINYTAAHEAAKAHRASYDSKIDTWVSEGTATGFNDATTDIHAMAKDLDTEIPD